MSIRLHTALVLVVGMAIYLAAGAAVQRRVLMPQIAAIEQDEALVDMTRASRALDREAHALCVLTRDWGTWDVVYDHMAPPATAYHRSSLRAEADEAAEDAGIAAIVLCDRRGRIVWSRCHDAVSRAPVRIAELQGPALPAALSRLYEATTSGGSRHGLAATERGLMLLASAPILTSTGKGPPRGAIIMARYFDDAAGRRLAEQAGIRLAVQPLATLPPAAAAAAVRMSSSAEAWVTTVNEGTLRAQRVLAGLDRQPLVVLEVEHDRRATEGGRRVMRSAQALASATAVLMLLALLLVLNLAVLGPVAALTRHVVGVAQTGDLESRLVSRRRDEIGVLAREFDAMLEALRAARQTLLVQTYREGMAEMAAGLLHNIRNMLSSMVVQTEQARHTIHPRQLGKLRLALEELSSGRATPQRAAALQQYVQLAASSLLETLGDSHERLTSVCQQTRRMDELLSEQESAERVELRTRALRLEVLVRDSLPLVSDLTREALDLEVDEAALAAAGPVQGAPTPLMLVLANILTNAVEAARASGRERVRVQVSSGRVTGHDGAPRARLSISDDGPGVQPSNLPHLFERGYSTKSTSRGLGLHWSANAVSAIGGTIAAESEGPGKGTAFHLLLPLAAPAHLED